MNRKYRDFFFKKTFNEFFYAKFPDIDADFTGKP